MSWLPNTWTPPARTVSLASACEALARLQALGSAAASCVGEQETPPVPAEIVPSEGPISPAPLPGGVYSSDGCCIAMRPAQARGLTGWRKYQAVSVPLKFNQVAPPNPLRRSLIFIGDNTLSQVWFDRSINLPNSQGLQIGATVTPSSVLTDDVWGLYVQLAWYICPGFPGQIISAYEEYYLR